MFCPFCGNQLEDGSKFCQFCGKPLELAGSDADQGVEPEQAAGPAEPEKSASPAEPEQTEEPAEPKALEPEPEEDAVNPGEPGDTRVFSNDEFSDLPDESKGEEISENGGNGSYDSYGGAGQDGYQQSGYGNNYQQNGYENGYQQSGYGNGYQQSGYGNGYQQNGYGNNYQQNGYGNGYQNDPYGNQEGPEVNEFAQRAYERESRYQTAARKRQRNQRILLGVIVGVIAVLAVCLILVLAKPEWFPFLGGKKDKKESTAAASSVSAVSADSAATPIPTVTPTPTVTVAPTITPAPTAAASGTVSKNPAAQRLTDSDVSGLSKEALRRLRNEIAARHGRRFSDPSLQAYFDVQPWYHGTTDPDTFDKQYHYTKLEEANLSLIRKYENR